MKTNRIALASKTSPGELTTFYSFESGTARSDALWNMAVLLAGRQNATVPVLMIDWDTESPGLHHYLDRHEEHDGLLEYFQECRDYLDTLERDPDRTDDVALARQVLGAVDWAPYVERVDQSRPLYLMRAGRFDDTYGERSQHMDWEGLFAACPALFRCFAGHMARQFRHVLVDARSGRSAAASICTTLLPRKLVMLFTPSQRSLDGLAGVVSRALEYRACHPDEQRPLLVYPLPCSVDSADCERRTRWRRGDPHQGVAGYQPALEQLLRQAYGISRLSLDSYLDEVQLQQTSAMAGPERGRDRFSLARGFENLLAWVADGHFPWQSQAEVRLQGAIAAARAVLGDSIGTALSVPLARDLHRLGELYCKEGREQQAQECFEESTTLRRRLLGDDHADTRASRDSLASLLLQCGKLDEARFLYELLLDDCMRLLGAGHPETLTARAGLAATLAQLEEFEPALALHEQVIGTFERLLGPGHAMTLDSLAGQARTLVRQGELSRARMVYQRVLAGRRRLLGCEHADTLCCSQQLARVLRQLGQLGEARSLQEGVVRARERHAGPDHPDTLRARAALADILNAQDGSVAAGPRTVDMGRRQINVVAG
jgi:tetratricopeptide (TPR) repeat protein